MERFIRFNNELVDAGDLLHFERLAQAWMNTSNVELTERQLAEIHTTDGTLSVSVFWRHRTKQVSHAGRMTDVLLLTLGFFPHFSFKAYQEFENEVSDMRYPELAKQLLFLVEEYRFNEHIQQIRRGTRKWFQLRQTTTLPYYKQQYASFHQRGFDGDAILYYMAIALYEGTLRLPQHPDYEALIPFLNQARSLRATSESADFVLGLLYRLEHIIKKDATLTHFQHITGSQTNFNQFTYHRGLKKKLHESTKEKESVEETLPTWHQESEEEKCLHLRFEIEHGRDSDMVDPDGKTEEGREDHEPTTIGLGKDTKSKQETYDSSALTYTFETRVHQHVEKIEQYAAEHSTAHASQITQTRYLQQPYVRQLTSLFEKEMAKKQTDKWERLTKGRLQKNLIPIWTEERPRVFYRKGQESRDLDAVFYLLIDGSASMQDKLSETKEAVLYIHDVLRKLAIPHRIVQHYEDAYDATENYQPNYFIVAHDYADIQQDAAPQIFHLEAHEDNRDGYALRETGKSLLARPEKQKFLLYFSDGEPSAFDYREKGIVDTAEAVQWLEKQQIAFLHLFLSESVVTEEQFQLFRIIYGNKTAATHSLDQFTSEARRLLKRMLDHLLKQL